MVSKDVKLKFRVLFLVNFFIGCASQQANISWDLRPTSIADYGYSAENPIRIGQTKDLRKNVDLCQFYLSCLRTIDQQPLAIVSRASVDDPVHDPKQAKGFLGMPLRGAGSKGGILDLYELVSLNGSDTFQLFFDIYHKDTLLVPKGLLFIAPGL